MTKADDIRARWAGFDHADFDTSLTWRAATDIATLLAELDALRERAERAETERDSLREAARIGERIDAAHVDRMVEILELRAKLAALGKVRDAAERVVEVWFDGGSIYGETRALRLALDAARGEVGG